MSRVPYSLTAIRSDDDSSGKNIVPYASVSVVDANENPAQIYFQETGGSPSSSFALNENGFKQIWAEPGRYTITISGGETYDIFLTGELSDGVQSVATIADLRALQSTSVGQVAVAGNGETYRYASGDTASIDDGYHVIVADNGARWVRVNETEGVYIPSYTPPPKPNKLNAIRSEMEAAYYGTILGGGYYSVGSSASDFVYETAINAEGGTNGTFQIRARFGIASPRFSKTGGPLTVKVQMGDNLDGVSIAALSFQTEDLPSTSLAARGSLVHAGGGLYELTVTPNASWSDFFGIQVSLTPIDSRNDETIHPEFWVVRRAWIEQDSVTIMDTSRARVDDGVYVAQIAARVVTTTFFAEKITTTSDEFLINHSRFMTGAQVSACWITNSGGAETGYGNIENPVSLARAAKLCQLGMVRRFLFKDPGVYEFVGPRPTNLFPASDADVIMMAPNGDVEIRAGHWLDLSGTTWLSGGFYVDYDFTNNFASTNIAAGTSRPAIIRYGNKPLTEVVDEALVATTPNSYFWDLTNSRFKVNVPDLTAPLVVPECDAIVSATKAGIVRLVNIYADVARSSFLKQLGGQPWCEFYSSGMRGGTIANDMFRHEGGHGFAVDCVAIGAGNDGFNYHDTGSFRLFDCIAMHCKGDGVSPHEECTLEIIGGSFSDNVRAGVIPAYGAHCICYKTEASDNAAGLDKYGNFMCLSNSSLNPYNGNPQGDTRMTLIDCRSDGGGYGVVSRGYRSFIYDVFTTISDQSEANIGSYDSIPTTGYGSIVSVNRSPNDIDYTDGSKVLFSR